MPYLILESFNPYADRYPDRRVISRKGLHVAKMLRAQGIDVRIAGDADHELNFLATKGVHEWFSDPIVVTLVGIPLSIACGVIANALSDLIRDREPQPTDVILEIDDKGSRAHYTCDGQRLDDSQFKSLLDAMQERQRNHAHAMRITSPLPAKPVPLFLEHTNRVVGWAHLAVDDTGLRVTEAVITDDETLERINEGSLRGFSIGALVREAKCNICGGSYFDCQHLSNHSYDGQLCVAQLTGLDLGEVSIVANPVNPLAHIVKAPTAREDKP